MNIQRTKLYLKIRHPAKDLSPLIALFGLQPVRIWKVGDERQTPKGTRIGGMREDSRCSFEFGQPEEPLLDKISSALAFLKPHREILQEMSSSGGQISFYIGWFLERDTGEVFNGMIWQAMAEMRIDLDLAMYIPDRAEGELFDQFDD